MLGLALILLPVLELWREEISIDGNFSLFALDVLCMSVISLDAAVATYFKCLQSDARGRSGLSIAAYPLLCSSLWVAWILQQLQIVQIAGFVMPLLLFVTNSELRLTVTIFLRFRLPALQLYT